ncbi:Coiled-coil domain-containing protein 122 [Channa argus]|uniref:Coiled-coil domain-containing protein 122 n=1 Tax=Channa argus TaxID=215402 RepID=A0A6G1PE39_CHAAH|nr:Coiled-coil domain-containing protein 122 [Channa argus]
MFDPNKPALLADAQMSNSRHSEDGTPEFSLSKAVEDVSTHGYALTETLTEKEKRLSALQAAHSDVEKKTEVAQQELRSKVREILLLECEMEQAERRITVLHGRCVFISKENTELQILISEEEESAAMTLAGFSTYRKKMEDHRAAVLHASSQTEVHKELEEKRALVRMLRQKKEELMEDLKSSDGNTVQMAKIQNRRYEAIVKRLHCQLSRAQAVQRQMSEDIYRMERQLAELKQQQESSPDLAVSGYENIVSGLYHFQKHDL